MSKQTNICLRYGCSACCNPVKIRSLVIINTKDERLPFVDLSMIYAPKMHPDSVKLKTYKCKFFNEETGLCVDYNGRPNICRNTQCSAFDTDNEDEIAKIIENIKKEEFIKIPIKRG